MGKFIAKGFVLEDEIISGPFTIKGIGGLLLLTIVFAFFHKSQGSSFRFEIWFVQSCIE